MSSTGLVTYDGLPASAGGAHRLRTRSPEAAFGQAQHFVDACARTISTPEVTLQLWSGGPADHAEPLAAFAMKRLGGPRRREQTHTEWRVRADAVDDVLDTLGKAGARAVTRHGHPLAALVWNAEALLIDPGTRATYSGVGADAFGRFAVDGYGRLLGVSGVRASIGTTASSLSLWLSLPGDDRLAAAAAHVQEHLPFRLSAKHWRRWRPTRDGKAYRATKIPSPLD